MHCTAVAAAALDLGRQSEAADILDALAKETRSPRLSEMATQLRAKLANKHSCAQRALSDKGRCGWT